VSEDVHSSNNSPQTNFIQEVPNTQHFGSVDQMINYFECQKHLLDTKFAEEVIRYLNQTKERGYELQKVKP